MTEATEDAPEASEIPVVELDVADTPEAKLTAALAAAQGGFPAIAKTKTAIVKTKGGAEYSYTYADLADVLTAVRPVLAVNGLAVIQKTFREGASVILSTELKHVGGGIERSEVDLGRNATDPQAFGGALTYLRRYELVTLLGLSPEDDRDAQDVADTGAPAAVEVPPWQRPVTDARKRELRDALAPFFGADVVAAVGKAFANPDTGYGLVPDGFVAFAKALVETNLAFAARATAGEQDRAAEAGDAPSPEPAPDEPSPEPEAIASTAPPGPEPEPEPSPEDVAVDMAIAWAKGAGYETLKQVAGAKPGGKDGADPNRVMAAQAELNLRDLEDAEAAAAAQAAPEDVPIPGTVDPPDELPKDPAKAVGVLRGLGCICKHPIGDEPELDDACPLKGHGLPF